MAKQEKSIVYFTANEIILKDTKTLHGYELGQLAYDTLANQFYELTGRNPHVWTPVRNPIFMKEGRCEFIGTTLRGEGMMHEIVNLGSTFSGNIMDSTGTAQQSNTGSTSIRNAGFGILPPITADTQGLTRTSHLPYYIMKVVTSARVSGDYRLYSGWIKNSIGPTIGETPLLNTEGGIVVGFNAADTIWNIWHSNGDGVTAVSKTPLVPDILPPTSAQHFRVEMLFTTATNIVVNVYNAAHTLLGTATINTNVLATAKSINWAFAVQNPNQTSKAITAYGAFMRAIL